ncbi:MAG: hypothetical protein WCT22_03655 [Patescibacteria group bacterium]
MEAKKFRRLATSLILIAALITACGRGAKATSTPELLALPTPSSSPLPDSFPTATSTGVNCATIAFPQPKNAFRAWLQLGQPANMTFHNDAGPDGDGSETSVTRDTLPTLVHVGDSICTP